MAVTKRNYIPGEFEAVSGEPVDTPVLNTWYGFKLDGLFNFDLSDVVLYQAAVAIPETAYELAEDSTYTAREESLSGETLYKMFRITNPTYAGIATTVSGNNFGTAVDNELLYSLYQSAFVYNKDSYTASDSFTTSASQFRWLHSFGSLSSTATFAITDGGGDSRNKFTVENIDSTYPVVVSGDVDYNVLPGQTVEFYVEGGSLLWASSGWEALYNNDTPNNRYIANAQLLRPIEDDKKYQGSIVNSSGFAYVANFGEYPPTATDDRTSAAYVNDVEALYDVSGSQFDTVNASFYWHRMEVWHNGE